MLRRTAFVGCAHGNEQARIRNNDFDSNMSFGKEQEVLVPPLLSALVSVSNELLKCFLFKGRSLTVLGKKGLQESGL